LSATKYVYGVLASPQSTFMVTLQSRRSETARTHEPKNLHCKTTPQQQSTFMVNLQSRRTRVLTVQKRKKRKKRE
jgi:hypothetical protein